MKSASLYMLILSILAAIGSFLLPYKIIVSISQEIIALFGLLLAGALPTMILTATILRAGAFSPKRVGEYSEALEKQLSFWFTLFIWSLIACVAVMLSKAVDGYELLLPKIIRMHIFSSKFYNSALGFSSVQVVGRLWPMLNGLKSLLKLNSQIAIEESKKNVVEAATPKTPPSQLKPPEGHGSIVE